MKIYQIVSHEDGTRSETLSVASFEDLAPRLVQAVKEAPLLVNDYVLVLVEDADGSPFASRAPMMLVSTVIETFNKKETQNV